MITTWFTAVIPEEDGAGVGVGVGVGLGVGVGAGVGVAPLPPEELQPTSDIARATFERRAMNLKRIIPSLD
jgi:hypothetical protein